MRTRYLAIERITSELCKLLCGQYAQNVIEEYRQTLSVVIPELEPVTDLSLLQNVPPRLIPRLTALFYSINLDADIAHSIMHRLRLDAHTIACVKRLLSCTNAPLDTNQDLLQLLQILDRELIFDHLSLSKCDATVFQRVTTLLEENICYKISMLVINGNDLIAAGIPSGPAIGLTLHRLLDAVISGDCPNTKTELLRYIKEYNVCATPHRRFPF